MIISLYSALLGLHQFWASHLRNRLSPWDSLLRESNKNLQESRKKSAMWKGRKSSLLRLEETKTDMKAVSRYGKGCYREKGHKLPRGQEVKGCGKS